MRIDKGEALKRLKKRIKNMPMLAIPIMFFGRVLLGLRTYRRILKACPPKDGWRIHFMDYDGSGDTYLICGYLQSKELIGEQDAFVASGGLSMKIAKLFPFGRFFQVEPKAALTVRMMERFYGKRLTILPLLYESDFLEYSGVLRIMAGHRGMDFMSMLKVGLEINCGVPYEEGLWKQPEFSYDSLELDEIFRSYSLIPGKTVLLAPYAGKHDLWGIPMIFYEKLAQNLQAKGFTICTNSSDPQKEPPVPGTTPLLIPHRLMRPFCEQAGCFIGLRSGLCDIISDAKKCTKVILSGDMTIPSAIVSHHNFFSLKNMGLCENAIEIEYHRNAPEKILFQIITLI